MRFAILHARISVQICILGMEWDGMRMALDWIGQIELIRDMAGTSIAYIWTGCLELGSLLLHHFA